MRVRVIGGGPAGLYLARLLALWAVADEVVVDERNPRGATFGFGISLASAALKHLDAADPDSCAQIRAALLVADKQQQRIRTPRGEVVLDFALGSNGAISRLEMLTILEQACADVGVVVRHESPVEPDDLGDFDLVVAADGANSPIREQFANDFGVSTTQMSNRFAWYGLDAALDMPALDFRAVPGGCVIGHYYPYGPDKSTFVVECDEGAWFGSGLADATQAERTGFSEEVFADVLEGRPLVDNRSLWRQFSLLGVESWSRGNMVLIGDALYPAHFSIGSGTRLAMEDSIALATGLRDTADIGAALAEFESAHRPKKAVLADAAALSAKWYEDLAGQMAVDVYEFAFDFLTRTGRLDEEKLSFGLPEFMAELRRRRGATV